MDLRGAVRALRAWEVGVGRGSLEVLGDGNFRAVEGVTMAMLLKPIFGSV